VSEPASIHPIPVARSPIAPEAPVVRFGWEVSARAARGDLSLSDETPLAKVAVRAPFGGAAADVLGVGFGRTARTRVDPVGDVLVAGSGPGEWLVLADPGTAPELVGALTRLLEPTGEFVTVVDLTHGRALVRLEGRSSPQVLAKVCGIDLSESVTPDGAALRTSVARVVTDVVRDDRGTTPSYLLHVERSSGQYLADALRDAGAEFGLETGTFVGLTGRAA
jgi:sarcosine oxidase subunit gamma